MSEYVNNKELLEAIKKWKAECREKGEKVKQSDYIGKCIILIAQNFSGYFKFAGYTNSWKEEMVGDAIEAATRGLFNFDETVYTNPHVYITKACFNAFVQRITKERRETAKKYSFFVNNVYDSMDSDMVAIADETFIQDIHDKINHYEASSKKKEAIEDIPKEKNNNLDFFYE